MQDAQQHARQGASRDAMHAMHTGHGDVAAGTWATLAEAASILGCSVDTVRRRIRRGELYAVQDAGRHGPTWRVLLSVTPGVLLTPDNAPCSTPGVTPSVDGATPSVAPGSQDSTPGSVPNAGEDSPALLEALRMLDALRRENRDLAAQVGYLQARVQVQEETIRALQTPQDAREATQEGCRTAETPEPTAESSDPSAEPSEPLAPDPLPPTTDGRQPWWWRYWPAFTAAILVLIASGMSCQPFGPG